MITLFSASTFDENTDLYNTGLGVISDAISCQVTEELNGEYTLEMVYPQSGLRVNDLQVRNIIATPVAPEKTSELDMEPFRIMSVSKPLDGKITVRANHISYDLGGLVVSPFTMPAGTTVLSTLTELFTRPGVTNPFTPATNKTTTASFVNRYHSTIRNCLAGRRGSVLDKYGGEFYWNRYTVNLLTRRGRANSGVLIAYGKNLTGLVVDTDASNVYSHVQAFWYDAESNEESYGSRRPTGASGLERTLLLDASEDYDTKPIASTLNTYADNYIAAHDLTVPTVSIDVNFVDLSQSEDYKKFRDLEKVELGDTVTVWHAALGVNITTRVRQTVFDVLRDRYTVLKLGSVRAGIVDQIVSNNIVAKEAMTAVQTQTAIKDETDKCLKLAGGTMTGQIAKTEAGGSYWKGRDNAVTKTTSATNSSYFYPGQSMKTGSGSWDVGTYGEGLAIHYQKDTDYTNSTNTPVTVTISSAGVFSGDISGNAANVSGVVGYDHGGTAATSKADAQSNLDILPTTGGTMTSSGQIEKSGSGGAYWRGRDNSITKTTAATNSSYFYPITSIKTNSGTWDIGSIGEKLALHYQTDSDYTGQNNTNATYYIDTDGSYSESSGPALPLAIANGGTAATTAVSALSNLFGTSPTWSTPTLGSYASAVSGGYVQYGKLVIVQLEITSQNAVSSGGANRSFLMGLPTPTQTAALSICPTSANYVSDVHAYIATNGRLNMIWASGVDMNALSKYRVSGIYMIA